VLPKMFCIVKHCTVFNYTQSAHDPSSFGSNSAALNTSTANLANILNHNHAIIRESLI